MFTFKMAPLKDFALTVRVILLLSCILGVNLTCNPPEDFAEISICRNAKHIGWSFYVDTLSVQQNNAGVCKCSVNISETVQDVQVSYTYQGPSSTCDGRFQFNLANLTLTCNATATTLAAEDFDVVEFRKETNAQIEPACLLIYLDRNLDPATITCYESATLSTLVSNVTIPMTSTIATTSDNSTSTSTVSSTKPPASTATQSSTESTADTKSLDVSSRTSTGMTSTTEPSKFNEIIVIAVVAGVGGFLLVLVLIVICITCCRSTHSSAMYDVKRKQLDSTSTSDIDLTENAFYNVALVNSPNYYS